MPKKSVIQLVRSLLSRTHFLTPFETTPSKPLAGESTLRSSFLYSSALLSAPPSHSLRQFSEIPEGKVLQHSLSKFPSTSSTSSKDKVLLAGGSEEILHLISETLNTMKDHPVITGAVGAYATYSGMRTHQDRLLQGIQLATADIRKNKDRLLLTIYQAREMAYTIVEDRINRREAQNLRSEVASLIHQIHAIKSGLPSPIIIVPPLGKKWKNEIYFLDKTAHELAANIFISDMIFSVSR